MITTDFDSVNNTGTRETKNAALKIILKASVL